MPYERIVSTAVHANDWNVIPGWVRTSLTTHITNTGPYLASVLEDDSANGPNEYFFHGHKLGRRHSVVRLRNGADATDEGRLPIFPPTRTGPETTTCKSPPKKDWQGPPPPPGCAMPVAIPLVSVLA